MGAANTTFAAATYPDLARAIILEDPPWFAEDSAEERASTLETWRAEIVERKTQSMQAVLTAGQEEHPRWTAVDWNPWAESKRQVNPDVVEWIRSVTLLAAWRELLPKITCPILVITGDPQLGAIVTPEIVQEILALSNNVEVAPIDGVGHCIRWENFEEYVSVIGTFLRRVQV
jgi:pimeloyl-ACP methyl ester carboxylesterase